MQLHVHFLPDLVHADQLTDRVVVVVDVLRATTTITHALAAGAEAVMPCLEIAEARKMAAQIGPSAVLGGERQGLPIEGFDLGNSPAEYTHQTVGGRRLVFTTTNGTRAMRHARSARSVLLGAFVNFSAICEQLADEQAIHLLCAGTDGQVSREDVLFAGAVANHLAVDGPKFDLNDQARIAQDVWLQVASGAAIGSTSLKDSLRDSLGGLNLVEIGAASDIEMAAQLNVFEFVPTLDIETWRITTAGLCE